MLKSELQMCMRPFSITDRTEMNLVVHRAADVWNIHFSAQFLSKERQ